MPVKPGDLVELELEKKTLVGVLIPTPEYAGDVTIIKLDSGYNMGIENSKIKSMKLVEKHKEKPKSQKTARTKHGLPKITILHTGGTIASKAEYKTGAVVAMFKPEEIVEMFPELEDIANIDSRLVRNMASEMMRFPHYNILAKEIEAEINNGADGIIITHGTDTLHFTSAALAFILKDLPIPVLLVGAQRSSDRGSTDAALNLINAAYFIANSDFGDVAICMHENMNDAAALILPACKTRKMHTSRRDAFRPINTKPVARVNYNEEKISYFMRNYSKKDKKKELKLKLINENLKIGLLKTHTNMYSSEFLAFKGFDGLVVEGTGLGHLPNQEIDRYTKENKKIFLTLQKMIKAGLIVVMAPQTIYGRLQMNVYQPQRELQEIGVLGNYSDMTPETTFIKLAWLLSNFKKEQVPYLITKNLRGEMSERVTEGTFLI